MADYTIAAADVQYSGAATNLVAGEAIDAGEYIYRKTSDGKAYLADADAGTGAEQVLGMALNSAVAGQPVSYVGAGEVEVGAGVFTAEGEVVILSGAAGKCCPVADLGASDALVILGWSTDTDTIRLNIVRTGITLPAL